MSAFNTAALTASPLFLHKAPNPAALRYGTAGFRMAGEQIPAIAARLGPVFVQQIASVHQALVPKMNQQQQQAGGAAPRTIVCYGAMVTASHNPAGDNGLKIVEFPHAHMLGNSGELLSTKLARTKDAAEFDAVVAETLAELAAQKLQLPAAGTWGVVIGWDSRPSGKAIVEALALSVSAFGGVPLLAGQMTTPMLHWSVEQVNEIAVGSAQQLAEHIAQPSFLAGYLKHMYTVFEAAVKRVVLAQRAATTTKDAPAAVVAPRKRVIIVDCANGVGAPAMVQLQQMAASLKADGILDYTFVLQNADITAMDKLNKNCGADYVQKGGVFPEGFSLDFFEQQQSALPDKSKDTVLFYSLDGDADRVVAGTVVAAAAAGQKPQTVILEGDRFTALFATILCQKSDDGSSSSSNNASAAASSSSASAALTYGGVQTAYANGASTQYLKRCSNGMMKTEFALTGVKYVHAAAEKYDVGLYFESNGHGTVLASHAAQRQMKSGDSNNISANGRTILQLVSQSCGDAIANLLAAEFALIALQWTPAQWMALYTDYPCVQQKVPVPDPAVFKCLADNEQVLVAPAGAQDAIDAIVKAAGGAEGGVRAFVRPSGTESVVRLYVEAPGMETSKAVAAQLEALVKKLVA